MRLGRAMMIGGLLSACLLDEDEYASELALAQCDLLERCARGWFEKEFRDRDACVRDGEDAIDDVHDALFSECDFDDREARRCVSRVRGLSCEEWSRGDDQDACDLVYDCTE